jgi:uncharacterized protein (DUF885 family)
MAVPELCRLDVALFGARSCEAPETAKQSAQSRLAQGAELRRKSTEMQALLAFVGPTELGLLGAARSGEAEAVTMQSEARLMAAKQQLVARQECSLQVRSRQVPKEPKQISQVEAQRLSAGSHQPAELSKIFRQARATERMDVGETEQRDPKLLSAG